MNSDPIELFSAWYQDELQRSSDAVPGACCLSTTGLDGFPNARFVALKEVRDGGFIITGSLLPEKDKRLRAAQRWPSPSGGPKRSGR